MSITFEINKKYDGIEIHFSEKPTPQVLARLKELGFRWHPSKKVWYAKNSEERLEFAKSIQDNTTYEQISLFDIEDTADPVEVVKEEPKVEEKPQAKDEPKTEKPKTTTKTTKAKTTKAEPKADTKPQAKKKDNIIEFAKARPDVKVRMALDEQATIEECIEKIEKEKAIYKDSDSQFVLDGLLEMCKVNGNFRNNFMRENKTYSGAFTYFSNLARQGYAHKINGVSFMDNNLALGFAMDYYNMIDE